MKSNEMAECTFTPQQPLVVDTCRRGAVFRCWVSHRVGQLCSLCRWWLTSLRVGLPLCFLALRFKNCEGLSRIAFLDGNGVVMLGKIVRGRRAGWTLSPFHLAYGTLWISPLSHHPKRLLRARARARARNRIRGRVPLL